MVDYGRLVSIMLDSIPALATGFVAEVDRRVAEVPEMAEEWAAIRPYFVRLEDAGVLRTVLESALAGAFAAVLAGKGTLGKGSHGRF